MNGAGQGWAADCSRFPVWPKHIKPYWLLEYRHALLHPALWVAAPPSVAFLRGPLSTHPHALESRQCPQGSQGSKRSQGFDGSQLRVAQPVGYQADDGDLQKGMGVVSEYRILRLLQVGPQSPETDLSLRQHLPAPTAPWIPSLMSSPIWWEEQPESCPRISGVCLLPQ